MSELPIRPESTPPKAETGRKDVIVKHLSGNEDLTQAFDVRRTVFHDEQGISEEDDFDGLDIQADHFIAFDGDKPVGTARVRYIDGKAKVERVAVLKPSRGKGVGEEMMRDILDFIAKNGINEVYLDSQTSASRLYEKVGFVKEGEEFEEVGIPHVKMVAKLDEKSS
ncbi:GNAT family N-acetyltransferase [Candidatus Saccharibacteria bacterium]|nr:GNAT family N-acetyltransferase [Candidatus Saccharibacteria bacterium]